MSFAHLRNKPLQKTIQLIETPIETPVETPIEACIFRPMEEFTQKMPVGYYSAQIIDTFTPFNKNDINYNTPIYQRNPTVTWRLSLNHLELLEYFVRLLKPKNFLELGVQFGECSNRLIDLVPRYYGVDIVQDENIDFLLINKPNFTFYKLTTDEFFKHIKEQGRNLNLDMVFIDAEHSHKSSYQDFLNVQEHLNEDGFIFFHDTYPSSIELTDLGLSGNCYLTSEMIRKYHHNNFEIITLPVNPGISIARKCTKQMLWL